MLVWGAEKMQLHLQRMLLIKIRPFLRLLQNRQKINNCNSLGAIQEEVAVSPSDLKLTYTFKTALVSISYPRASGKDHLYS